MLVTSILLVLTRRRKPYDRYLDAITNLDLPFNTDVVVKRVGEPFRRDFAWQVLEAYQIVYGDGECVREMVRALGDPTFEETWACIRVAKESITLADGKSEPIDRDRWIRIAFDNLSHASRIASMVYLATEETQWGGAIKNNTST